MDKFIIHGGNELNGEVVISGAKNAVLPIMAASLLVPGTYKINNVPNLRDTRTMIELLKTIGSNVEFYNNSLIIDIPKKTDHEIWTNAANTIEAACRQL